MYSSGDYIYIYICIIYINTSIYKYKYSFTYHTLAVSLSHLFITTNGLRPLSSAFFVTNFVCVFGPANNVYVYLVYI